MNTGTSVERCTTYPMFIRNVSPIEVRNGGNKIMQDANDLLKTIIEVCGY